MKRCLCAIIVILMLFTVFPLTFYGDANEDSSFSIDNVLISDDGKVLNVVCTIPAGASDGTYYLFRVTPDSYSIDNLTPIAEEESENHLVTFSLPYDTSDHSLALYGYILAAANSDGGYVSLTKARYVDNLSSFSHNSFPYPEAASKKGLEVQYITDAQLLGISSTVVHVKLNDLIAQEESEDTLSFVFGEVKYHIDINALTLLDYRIRTLSNAGIHVYMDLILSFDQNAPSYLYYSNAEGSTSTLFAPNMSSSENVGIFGALIHYLADRYSGGDRGFCGSYIIGYEVNNEGESNSAGFTSLKDYANAYSSFLRTAYLSVITAYSNARIYVSLSNQWNQPSENIRPYQFGGKEFLEELNNICSDVPFGVAINPYPSSLTQSAFWNDEKATMSTDSEYVTMKNISVLTDFLGSPEMLYQGSARSVVISEFGVGGKHSDPSEILQAAAYAHAFMIADADPLIESLIWHRHVDHVSEIGLNYGLYSSSEITLDGKDKKLIHSVMSVIDTDVKNRTSVLEKLASYLPSGSIDPLLSNILCRRQVINVSPAQSTPSSATHKKDTVFDLSKSLYTFYPSDNTEYIDSVRDGEDTFMRVATLTVSQIEYMGTGVDLSYDEVIKDSRYISIKMRVISPDDTAQVCVLLSGSKDGKSIVLNCTSEIDSGEWTVVNVPVHDLDLDSGSKVNFKLWVRSDSARNERLYIDVSEINTYSNKNVLPLVIISILVTVSVAVPVVGIAYVFVAKRLKTVKRR